MLNDDETCAVRVAEVVSIIQEAMGMDATASKALTTDEPCPEEGVI